MYRILSEKFSEFEKPQILQRMYELITVFAAQFFRSFWLLLFSLLLIAKSWILHKLLKLYSDLLDPWNK